MLYNIVNPSDAYTMVAGNDLAAGLATLILGEGQYGCMRIHPETGEETEAAPIFLFSGQDAVEKWIVEKSDYRDLDHAMSAKRAEIAMALDTVLIGTPADRALFQAATEKMNAGGRVRYANEYHDKKRSSLNDIGKRAHLIAAAMRKKQAAEA